MKKINEKHINTYADMANRIFSKILFWMQPYNSNVIKYNKKHAKSPHSYWILNARKKTHSISRQT